MIDPAAATVGERFKDKPLVEAAVRRALASAYESVGRGDLALPQRAGACPPPPRTWRQSPRYAGVRARPGHSVGSLGRFDEASRCCANRSTVVAGS